MNDSIVKSAFFACSADLIWSFLTDKDKLGQWLHPARADLTEGSDFEMIRPADDGTDAVVISGRVLLAERPRKLVHTFAIAPFQGAETTVTWLIDPIAGGVRVLMTHEGVGAAGGEAAMGLLRALDHGWAAHLETLFQAVAPQPADA